MDGRKTALKAMKTLGAPGMVLLSLGVLVFVNALVVSFAANFHLGTVLTYLLGGLLVGLGFLYKKMAGWCRCLVITVLSLGLALLSLLPIYGSRDTVSYEEDVLIVLGAGIRGEEPSAGLKKRLDAAYGYALENPSALIVVSGGQGSQEDVTESYAMKRYLIQKGLSSQRIIEEDRATGTEENFLFSKELLDTLLGPSYDVAFVTNDYHVFRAENMAQKVGLERVTTLSAPTPFWSALPNFMRECVAILYNWLF